MKSLSLSSTWVLRMIGAVACLGWMAVVDVHAVDAVCVKVGVKLEQHLTGERQAFDAKLVITNGSTTDSLENVRVSLLFQDQNGNSVVATSGTSDLNAKFFYSLTSGAVSVVPASQAATLTWLIIPAAGAAGNNSSGTLYGIGGTLQYKLNGEEVSVTLEPDSIMVKPMPNITLDYFLKEEVYGDDPFTLTVEPPVPYSLGIRVRNNGYGKASNLQIDSGQPQITDNPQGLAVEFKLLGSEVQGLPSSASLLANFGDLDPSKAKVARWIMTSSITGTFTFSVTITHADELGGQVTSLLNPGVANALIQDVLVDLPGRDNVRDFFAKDRTDEKYYVYESEVFDETVTRSEVTYEQYDVTPLGTANTLSVSTPVHSGFVAARYLDPFNGTKELSYAVRSDGKLINAANAWLAKTWDRNVHVWHYYVNVFDDGNAARPWTYTLYFDVGRRPPTLFGVVDRIIAAGTPLTMAFSATNSSGTIPVITTSALPAGAVFSGGPAQGTINWTPTVAQVGSYPIRVTATDGSLANSKTATITVTTLSTHKAWKEKYWPGVTDPNIVGNSADPDHDGISNLMEYAFNFDPTKLTADEGIMIGIDEINGGRYLTLTYVVRTDDASLQTVVVGANEANANDVAWQTLTTQSVENVDQTDVPSGMIRVKARDSVELGAGPPRRFLKLKVTINED